jgi:hypothetical protein
MNSQAIVRRTYTAVATFVGIPNEHTRKALIDAGFTYDGRSRQWFRKTEESTVVSEENVANYFAS